MAEHRSNEEERMEGDDLDLEGSEKNVTDSMVEDQLDNQSTTGLSKAVSRIRVEVGSFKKIEWVSAVGTKINTPNNPIKCTLNIVLAKIKPR